MEEEDLDSREGIILEILSCGELEKGGGEG